MVFFGPPEDEPVKRVKIGSTTFVIYGDQKQVVRIILTLMAVAALPMVYQYYTRTGSFYYLQELEKRRKKREEALLKQRQSERVLDTLNAMYEEYDSEFKSYNAGKR